MAELDVATNPNMKPVIADLTNGNWQLKIIATQDTKQGTASAVVKVN
jgi:hypothetical protein